MEARIARLASDVAHVRSDIADIKLDLRAVRDKVDGVGSQLNAKVDAVRDSIGSVKVWALTLYIALAAVMLGTLARGFDWI